MLLLLLLYIVEGREAISKCNMRKRNKANIDIDDSGEAFWPHASKGVHLWAQYAYSLRVRKSPTDVSKHRRCACMRTVDVIISNVCVYARIYI